jgi:hypothetical protein
MGKNCAWIQRKIVARVRRRGPVKKNIPLLDLESMFSYESVRAEMLMCSEDRDQGGMGMVGKGLLRNSR